MSGSMSQDKADWWARVLGLLSLAVSGFTLYCSVLRSPDIEVSLGQHVLLNKKPRIGVFCTFVNEGAKQSVVTSAQLKWDSPAITLTSEMTSSSLEQWEFDDKGNIATVSKTRYTPLVAPIPVKGHDQTSVFFWFTSTDKAFMFKAGDHDVLLGVTSGSSEISQKQLRIVISSDVAGALNDPNSSPTGEYRAKVASQ
jgi:hypothetical protein